MLSCVRRGTTQITSKSAPAETDLARTNPGRQRVLYMEHIPKVAQNACLEDRAELAQIVELLGDPVALGIGFGRD